MAYSCYTTNCGQRWLPNASHFNTDRLSSNYKSDGYGNFIAQLSHAFAANGNPASRIPSIIQNFKLFKL